MSSSFELGTSRNNVNEVDKSWTKTRIILYWIISMYWHESWRYPLAKSVAFVLVHEYLGIRALLTFEFLEYMFHVWRKSGFVDITAWKLPETSSISLPEIYGRLRLYHCLKTTGDFVYIIAWKLPETSSISLPEIYRRLRLYHCLKYAGDFVDVNHSSKPSVLTASLDVESLFTNVCTYQLVKRSIAY